jgi:glycerol transport system ATP-binding protein
MVYQQFINYPHLSVLDNVAFPLRRRGMGRAQARQRAGEVLAKVGLSGFEGRRPGQLSGGQQQRVALARALARRAGILLLDEPLVNLDYKLREQLRDEFRGLFADQREAIVVYATTEPAEAMMLGDEVLVLHEGRLLQAGHPADVFDRPASTAVAAVVNDPPMNIVDGAVEDGSLRFAGGLRLPLPAHLQALPPGDYRFGARANELWIAADGGIAGDLALAEVSGSETILHVETGIGPLVLLVEGIHALPLGARVSVGVDPRRLFAFATAGDLVAAP